MYPDNASQRHCERIVPIFIGRAEPNLRQRTLPHTLGATVRALPLSDLARFDLEAVRHAIQLLGGRDAAIIGIAGGTRCMLLSYVRQSR